MSLSIIYKVTPVKIGALTLDASIQESHTADVEATEHPVEDGANITDHAREKPESVTIEGVVSNTPISKSERDKAGEQVKGDSSVPAQKALEQLLKMKADRQFLTLVTSLRQYTDMLLVGLSIPRSAKIGDALRFSAQFRQIRVVKNQTVKLNSIPRKPVGKVKKGKVLAKGAEKPEAKKEAGSVLFDTFVRR